MSDRNHGSIPPNSAPAVVGLIIQRSTIELFDAYEVAVAPVIASGAHSLIVPPDHLIGTVLLTGVTHRGLLTLACSRVTLARMRPNADRPFGLQDWLRELTNQLAGRIKNRFGRYRVPIHVGLPSASAGGVGEPNRDVQQSALVYLFRTLKDDVYVMLSGGFDSATFDLQGGPNPAEEGDIILF